MVASDGNWAEIETNLGFPAFAIQRVLPLGNISQPEHPSSKAFKPKPCISPKPRPWAAPNELVDHMQSPMTLNSLTVERPQIQTSRSRSHIYTFSRENRNRS